MKSPHEGFTPPDFSGQSKTIFYSDGNPAATLVTNRAGRRSVKSFEFPQAEDALVWCRRHGAMLVYLPPDPSRN